MSADAQMRIAAKAMAESLRDWRRLQEQARDRGDASMQLDVEELFEAKDRAALAAYDAAIIEISGARPLFDEAI